MERNTYRVGIDIGGTFTDIVLMDQSGLILPVKVSSTPDDYSRGIGEGVAKLLADNGIAAEQVEEVVHATTVATNAVLENKGARTGLITTAGFRDVLEFRRIRVPELYNLNYVKPRPLVPRRYRLEVRERLAPDGSVREPLDERSVHEAAERLKAAGIEAVAICLLHAYANPAHEQAVAAIVGRVLGDGVFITCSHEILPEMREYERTSTTVVNAFLGPLMNRYLASLRRRLEAAGIRRQLNIMQSNGGQMGVAAAIKKPAYLVESGPAAGVIAAARIASQSGLKDVITLDIGGTTAKTAIVENGLPTKTGEYEIGAGINLSSRLIKGAGYAIKLPFIDVSEIGAGGGSHVWFDKGGLLKVGPQSAGSVPGPVCYGQGGATATLTDAMLALGYINPHYLVGGALRLDGAASLKAIESQVARAMNTPVRDAALGVFRIAVANMVRAVKSVSTYRGRDPREYTLIAFGGNGPLVASAIAAELSMKRVLVPPFPGVLSALGLLIADNAHELVHALAGNLRTMPAERIAGAFDELTGKAEQGLRAEGVAADRIQTSRFVDVRYAGQAYELTVPVAATGQPDVAQIEAAFHGEHLKTYGHKAEAELVELVAIRVIAAVPSRPLPERLGGRPASRTGAQAERPAYFGPENGVIGTPVVARADLAGRSIEGPVIVEEYDSTVLVPPGATATVDARNNIVITLASDR
ncbi:MAG: hydantoinase/oxoprolinase family protein [Proteobacteria bacterium]|nr:hydantoinase/oxoprolinase family protein [Pseudomonadota bacterium]